MVYRDSETITENWRVFRVHCDDYPQDDMNIIAEYEEEAKETYIQVLKNDGYEVAASAYFRIEQILSDIYRRG